jgi:hypothetical protein
MREVKSDEARRAFRDLLDEVQRDPAAAVHILRYDKPVAVVVSEEWFRQISELKRFPLDMAQVKCPDCQADSYPDDLGEAVRWVLGHGCAAADLPGHQIHEGEQDHG